jgi:plasmid stability protein
MPTTLTLKNIPDDVYERLKMAARAHRRSLNSEAIVCIEAALLPSQTTVAERLERARQLRSGFGAVRFSAADIDEFKSEGRA